MATYIPVTFVQTTDTGTKKYLPGIRIITKHGKKLFKLVPLRMSKHRAVQVADTMCMKYRKLGMLK